MTNNQLSVGAEQLRTWLEDKKDVIVLDVRPKEQRKEWQIPGSVYVDAYQQLNANDLSVLDEVNIPENVPVITVCAAGKTSMIAANELRRKGIEAYSLEGGMKAWSTAWNTATITFDKFEVVQFRRTGKGCLSYLIISEKEAAIVDASLPIDAYEQFLTKRNSTLKFVIDTHIHADHLSRSRQLAEKYSIPYYLPVQNRVSFSFKPIAEETNLTVGNISIKPISTPGHTLESTSYLIDEKVILTGDTLFIDSIGRPDLKASTEETKDKASLLYHSLQKLMALDENTIVLPGHTSKPVEFNHIPIQASLSSIKQNVAMLHLEEEEFVETILQRIPPTPANYLTIVEKNIKGEYADVNPADLEAGANRCAIS
jgi:glyoxylase-like metal-dependent hydrolase (beta-lactamase superfamily II)